MKINVDNPFQSPAILSFCPGLLGLERGLVRAIGPIRVVAYVEIEAFIIANLVAGMEAGVLDSAPIWTDATTFDARPFRGKVHGIIGGYPCPGESLAGLREGHLYKGFIWPSIRRAVAAARPLWCFFENVDDHLTGTYPIVSRSLRNMGYAVEAGIYSAEEVGAPHERQRLFILAVDDAYLKHRSLSAGQQGQVRQPSEYLRDAARTSQEMDHSDSGRQKQEQQMADASGSGSQRMQQRLVQREGQRVSRPVTKCRPEDFPLGQGFKQRDWEQPREIESGVEYTINGYDFTGDLVRAIGNMVVEQTADVAFRDLLRKHGLKVK